MLIKILREGLGRLIVFIDFLTRPKPLVRAPARQREVDTLVGNLSLYQFYACPFCVRTRRAIHKLNLAIETRDAKKNPTHRAELLAGGGKIKVPCLRIEEHGESRWLYESVAIIEYLNERFGEQIDAPARR